MQITLLGFILIPLSMLLFLLKPDYLFYCMVFFSPFIAAAVVNIESVTFGVQPSYLFGMLWLLYCVINLRDKSINITVQQGRYIILLLAFWLVALVSLVMPLVFEGKIMVHGQSDVWGVKPLAFGMSNITQFMYLTFMILIAIFTIFELDNKDKFIKSIRVLFYSTIFCILWGVYQMICNYGGLTYPDFLFNNNIGFAQCWQQTFAGGLKRVSSVFTEPSVFSNYLVMMFSILIILWLNNLYIINPLIYNFLFAGCLAMLFLTTSSTAYIGTALVFFLVMVLFTFYKKREAGEGGRYRYVKGVYVNLKIPLLVGIAVAVILAVLVFAFQNDFDKLTKTVSAVTIEKSNSTSGMERSEGFFLGLEVLYESRLLGAGWGSNRTFDLVSGLLSNLGIAGFLVFVLFIISIVKEDISMYLNTSDRTNSLLSLGLAFCTVVSVIVLFISSADITFMYFWFVLGLSMAFPRINVFYSNDNYS